MSKKKCDCVSMEWCDECCPVKPATTSDDAGRVVAYTWAPDGMRTSVCGLYVLASDLDAVTAERGALQKQVERLKTVPMKYRRMEFNAQLQNQLAAKEKECERLRELLKVMLRATPTELRCTAFHHSKRDQHSLFDDVCGPQIRYNKARKAAEAALATGGSHD